MPENESSSYQPKTKRWNSNLVAIIAVVLTFTLSLLTVIRNRWKHEDTTKTTLRIAHWQLELGYRKALQNVIDKYQELHPDVRIIQIPVTEKVWGQWINTHMVSGTAPDLVEIGHSKILADPHKQSRFFIPITEFVNDKNPYNKGTAIENLPWRETFIDGMRGGYLAELQDYFSAPTSMVTIRIYYNKDLLKKVTGSDRAPETLDEYLNFCAKIRKYAQQTGEDIVPVAGSRFSVRFFVKRFMVIFGAPFESKLDFNLSGSIDQDEVYMGFCKGLISLHSPGIKACYECLRKICNEFQPGFMAVDRDQAAFLFVQGKAGMICTGSWDAYSLFEQAKFNVGIIDFPIPAKNGPYGKYIAGRANEAGTSGCCRFAIYKQCRNKEVALDFMKFFTSCIVNSAFNQEIEWLPIILTAEPSERMKPFMPDPTGFSSRVNFQYGSYVYTKLLGLQWRYLQGEIEYDEMADTVEKALRNPTYGGDITYARHYDSTVKRVRNHERTLALQAARRLMDPSADDASRKLNKLLITQVRHNNGAWLKYLFEQIRGKELELE